MQEADNVSLAPGQNGRRFADIFICFNSIYMVWISCIDMELCFQPFGWQHLSID